MQHYKNSSGKSGVSAFEIGDDFINSRMVLSIYIIIVVPAAKIFKK